MDWQTILVLAALTCLVLMALLRVEPRVRKRVWLILPIPAIILLWRWSVYRQVWIEPIVGLALGGLVTAAWWRWRGRRLPPPSSDNIRVWTRDQPFDD